MLKKINLTAHINPICLLEKRREISSFQSIWEGEVGVKQSVENTGSSWTVRLAYSIMCLVAYEALCKWEISLP